MQSHKGFVQAAFGETRQEIREVKRALWVTLDAFAFQQDEAAFQHSVVPAAPRAAHAGDQYGPSPA